MKKVTLPRIHRDVFIFIEAVCLMALFLFALVLESGYAVSLWWQFYVIMALFSLALTLPSVLLLKLKQALWLFCAFNIGLFSLYFVTISPVKPFRLFQRDIADGTTINAVQQLFSRRFPKNGNFRQPVWTVSKVKNITVDSNRFQLSAQPNQTIHYTLDPDDGAYNAEWLIVYFKDGRAVGTEYLGD